MPYGENEGYRPSWLWQQFKPVLMYLVVDLPAQYKGQTKKGGDLTCTRL